MILKKYDSKCKCVQSPGKLTFTEIPHHMQMSIVLVTWFWTRVNINLYVVRVRNFKNVTDHHLIGLELLIFKFLRVSQKVQTIPCDGGDYKW